MPDVTSLSPELSRSVSGRFSNLNPPHAVVEAVDPIVVHTDPLSYI